MIYRTLPSNSSPFNSTKASISDIDESMSWIILTQIGSKAVLTLLILLSVWSVAIIWERARALKRLGAQDATLDAEKLIRAKDWAGLKKWAQSRDGLHGQALLAALEVAPQGRDAHALERIEHAYKSFILSEKAKLESGFTTLATLGANAPFVGLFGTVLGIIQAFGALAQSQADTASMMAGLSEALVATAIGLFVAIPAVVAYNVFSRKLKVLLTECESLKDLFLAHQG